MRHRFPFLISLADRLPARAAGAVGLIATTDWSFSHGRDWGSPKIPEKMDILTAIKMCPQGLVRPSWFLDWATTFRPPSLTAPNQGRRGEAGPPFFAAYGEWMGTPPPTWEDIAWLREFWGGPFMLKGVMRVDDAKRAVDAGVTAISVSNHGGNNLDGTPGTIRALPAVAAAVVCTNLQLVTTRSSPPAVVVRNAMGWAAEPSTHAQLSIVKLAGVTLKKVTSSSMVVANWQLLMLTFAAYPRKPKKEHNYISVNDTTGY